MPFGLSSQKGILLAKTILHPLYEVLGSVLVVSILASTRDEVEGVPPMRSEQSEVQWNWTAIISFGVSSAVSLAMWAGIIRAFSC